MGPKLTGLLVFIWLVDDHQYYDPNDVANRILDIRYYKNLKAKNKEMEN